MTDAAKTGGRLRIADYDDRAKASDKLEGGLDTPLLGLFGEIGGLLSALKKKRRDADVYFGYRSAVIEELGDVLWYLAAIARRSGISLTDVFARARSGMVAPSGLCFEDLQEVQDSPTRPDEQPFEQALMELAGEAGDLIKRFTDGAFDENVDALRGDLIKLVRPMIGAANAADVSLADAANANLRKTADRWPTRREYPPLFDEGLHPDEQLPRVIRVEVYERDVNGKTYAFQKCNGVLIGSRLTDNRMEPDDYRFHDVFHLAYAAILGWSPIIRALFRVKRKSQPWVDENEDGARAIIIEEGLTTWIFEKAKDHQFFGATPQLGLDLLKAVKDFVRGYEPQGLPMWLWEKAILDGYSMFRKLRLRRRGIIVADLNKRSITFEELRS